MVGQVKKAGGGSVHQDGAEICAERIAGGVLSGLVEGGIAVGNDAEPVKVQVDVEGGAGQFLPGWKDCAAARITLAVKLSADRVRV